MVHGEFTLIRILSASPGQQPINLICWLQTCADTSVYQHPFMCNVLHPRFSADRDLCMGCASLPGSQGWRRGSSAWS